MTTEKNDLLTYDEDDAVKFIRKNNPSLALDDNQINYIVNKNQTCFVVTIYQNTNTAIRFFSSTGWIPINSATGDNAVADAGGMYIIIFIIQMQCIWVQSCPVWGDKIQHHLG